MKPRLRIFVSLSTGRCWPASFAEQPEMSPASVVKRGRKYAWTPEEDAILREFWPIGGVRLCASKLPARLPNAIMQRASKLGLSRRPAKATKAVKPAAPQPIVQPAAMPVIRKRGRGPMTFEEQMEAVARGARLVRVQPIRRSDPPGTLGGVVGEIF